MADSTCTVTREATIAAPPERIHPAVADFRRGREWSPWKEVDPQEPSRVAIDLRFEKPFKARNETVPAIAER